MTVFAVGDIQGCYDDLARLLDKLHFDSASDTLWLSGDLVNRGPDSLSVLRLVKELGDSAKTVLGNHDLHLLAMGLAGREVKRKDTLDKVLEAKDAGELLHWLRQQPLLHHCEDTGWTMVHAGISPQWSLKSAKKRAHEVETVLRSDAGPELLGAMYGNLPDRWSKKLTGIERYRYIINAFTRMRYCRTDKSLDLEFNQAPDNATPDLVPWFKHPKRKTRELPIVFGHWSTLGHHAEQGAVGLDTGCVWGGCLTAVELEANTTKPGLTVRLACKGALKPAQTNVTQASHS